LPIEVFDQLRANVQADRAQFFKDLSAPFYGPTGRAPKFPKACAIRSGCRG
jgi:hypothetical protein